MLYKANGLEDGPFRREFLILRLPLWGLKKQLKLGKLHLNTMMIMKRKKKRNFPDPGKMGFAGEADATRLSPYDRRKNRTTFLPRRAPPPPPPPPAPSPPPGPYYPPPSRPPEPKLSINFRKLVVFSAGSKEKKIYYDRHKYRRKGSDYWPFSKFLEFDLTTLYKFQLYICTNSIKPKVTFYKL